MVPAAATIGSQGLVARSRHALALAGRSAARVPVTIVFVTLVAAASGLLAAVSESQRDTLLAESSTNLAHLTRDPIRVLVASAFWVTPSALFVWVPLMLAVFAALELRFGARRLILIFAAGHVGATLLSVFGVWTGIQFGTVAPRVADSVDVGVSYGVASALAYATILLPARWRLPYAALLVVYFGPGLIEGRTFGDFGHVFALAVGFSLALAGYGLNEAPRKRRRGVRFSRRALFSGVAILTVSVALAGAAGIVERSPLVGGAKSPKQAVVSHQGATRKASAPAPVLHPARAPALTV